MRSPTHTKGIWAPAGTPADTASPRGTPPASSVNAYSTSSSSFGERRQQAAVFKQRNAGAYMIPLIMTDAPPTNPSQVHTGRGLFLSPARHAMVHVPHRRVSSTRGHDQVDRPHAELQRSQRA